MASLAIIAIAATFVLYAAYHFAEGATTAWSPRYPVAAFVARKLSGFVILGLGAVAVIAVSTPFTVRDFGLVPEMSARSWLWVAGFLVLIVPGTTLVSRRPESYAAYPQIRVPEWSAGTAVVNTAGWSVYLLGYEFLFRGFLLFACLAAMSTVAAIAVSTLLYSLAHLPQGRREALGSVPVGILFCLATIDTGAIWAAWLGHVLLSQFNDYIALAANPAMRFGKGDRP